MTTQSESQIEREVCRYARSLGWVVYKFVSPGNRGVPDRILLRDGRTVFIEFKRPGGQLSALQEMTIRRLTDTGFPVLIVDNVEDGQKQLDLLEHVRVA